MPGLRRHRVDLKLMNRSRFLAVCRSETIGPGIAAADDDDTLTGRTDFVSTADPVSGDSSVLLNQVIHRKMDAFQLPARNIQIAGLLSANREENGIILALQIFGRDVYTDVNSGSKLHPFGNHLLQA